MKTINIRTSICAAVIALPLYLALVVGSAWSSVVRADTNSGRRAVRIRSGACRPGARQDGGRSDSATAQSEQREQHDAEKPTGAEEASGPASPSQDDLLTILRRGGSVPKTAKPNAALSEAELNELVRGLARQLAVPVTSLAAVKQTSAPVIRLRVLTLLVRTAVRAEDIQSYREALPEQMPPDAATLPLWARPYAAAAIDRGWWSGDQALRPRDNATRAFVAQLLQKMLPAKEERSEPKSHAAVAKAAVLEDREESYTGLVIDARGMRVERQIGPRVLDEDGNVVYPDPKSLPEIDWLEDHGMADYATDEKSMPRAGEHPLTVKALNTLGAGHDDLVVSNAMAEQIRRAGRRTPFLKKWAVCILIDPK
jgi:hypothetical protein